MQDKSMQLLYAGSIVAWDNYAVIRDRSDDTAILT
ncbi:MAG: hypothetical protein ACI9ZV_000974, partial [Candidatus Azotimanducaceae bacterium]